MRSASERIPMESKKIRTSLNLYAGTPTLNPPSLPSGWDPICISWLTATLRTLTNIMLLQGMVWHARTLLVSQYDSRPPPFGEASFSLMLEYTQFSKQ